MNFLKGFTQRFKTVEEQPKETSLLLIPCINCQEFVKSNMIDNHARFCTSVSKNIDHIDKSYTLFEENNFKLQKIRLSLMDKKTNSLALRLCRIIELVSQITTIGNVEISCCQAYLDELNQLQCLPHSSLNLSLYIERIKSLIGEKISILQNELNTFTQETTKLQSSENMKNSSKSSYSISQNKRIEKSLKSQGLVEQINQKLQEYNNLKEEKNYYNHLIDQSLSINQGPKWASMEQIQVNLPKTSCKNQPTYLTQQKLKSEILTNMSSCDVGAHQDIQSQTKESLDQRIFYSKLLKLKLNTSKFQVSQKYSASKLWLKAQELQLKQDQWDDFLKANLSNPRFLQFQQK